MRIVHVSPHAPYNDYWGYQENLLPKYQRKLGYDVSLIVTNKMHQDGQIVKIHPVQYTLDDEVTVYRKEVKSFGNPRLSDLMCYMPVYEELASIKPDMVFFHSLISTSIFDAIRYKKKINPNCVIVMDNHLDYNIGFKFNTLTLKLVRMWYRIINHIASKYIKKVYGVTPWRKQYAEDYFKIPSSKTDVLIMGADDEKIDFSSKAIIRKRLRNELKISDNEFVIITGGKLDKNKNVISLMRACTGLENVKLVIFGNVLNDIKDEFDNILRQSINIKFIGWIPSDSVYDYYFMSDLVVFPGQHSVLWEQACASKTPCLIKRWDGMEHVNNGGNCEFLDDISMDGIRKKILSLIYTNDYYKMKDIAESDLTNIYLYSEIAKKSVECLEHNTAI